MQDARSTSTGRPRGALWLAIALAALLALAACADGEVDDAPVDAAPDVEEPVDTDDPEPEAAEEAEEADDGLPAAFEHGPQDPARVTYVRTAYTADGEVTEEDAFTISYDPPRSAFMVEGMRIVEDGEGSMWACEGDQCQEVPMEQGFGMTAALLGPMAMWHEQIRDGLHPGLDVEESEQEIAGRQAACVSVAATRDLGMEPDHDTLRSCVDVETGVVLSWELEYEDGRRDEVRASEFGEPREEDFATG